MNQVKQDLLERLFAIYAHQYEIDRDGCYGEGFFPATATFFLRDENYLISKKHVLSAVENYDYLYFCMADHLDVSSLQEMISRSLELGKKRIHPHKEHMSSLITLIILTDTIDDDAIRLIKKTRVRKYFRFAFHGWMEYRIAAMEISSTRFFSNPAGREPKKILEQNFDTKKKGWSHK